MPEKGVRKQNKNLRSLGELSKEERTEIARKGNKASLEARRRNADIKDAMKALMGMKAQGRSKELLAEMGYEDDEQLNANAIVAKLYSMAMAGNSKAMEMFLDYFFKANEDERKTKESNARVDAIKKNMGDLSVNSQDDDDGGVVIYLPEIERENEEQETTAGNRPDS